MHISLDGVQSITGTLSPGMRTPAILGRGASLSTAKKKQGIAKFRGLVTRDYESKTWIDWFMVLPLTCSSSELCCHLSRVSFLPISNKDIR
jgi:hypothetical protein